MPIEEGVAIILGPSDEYEVTLSYYLSLPTEGTSGAKSNAVTVGDSGFVADQVVNELVGKVGPTIEPYDPEGKNRLIQEF